MNAKPIALRERARRDVDEAAAYYLEEAGPAVAEAFIDAMEEVFRHVGERPASGSPRYAHELDIPGLRFRPAGKFPYLVFFIERDNSIEVWRVLHGARNIPERMRESNGG